jgi:hypothetical protein
MKKLTREHVLPIISASVSCDILGSNLWGWSSLAIPDFHKVYLSEQFCCSTDVTVAV